MSKFRRLLAAVGIVFLAGAACAQTAPLISNISARHTTSLNGTWRSIVDPFDVGSLDYRAKPLTNEGAFYRNHKPQTKSELVEYDFDKSPTLAVPGDWNTQRESLLFYEGTVWYKTSFNSSLQPGKRLFVHFGAVNYQAAGYLNGEPVGEHEGGFTPFDIEITGQIRPRDNVLIVRVNNDRKPDQVPTTNTDWWNYGGITRPVTLVETPATFIRDYVVQLAKGSRAQIQGWVQLDGAQPRQKVALRIPEAGVTQSFETDASGKAEFSFSAKLDLWSPEKPKLYDIAIEAETDRVSDRIGFRSIETRGTDILLNGEPVFLRGVSVHEEAPMRGGRAWSTDDARMLLTWAKDLGCNFVRLAHYPHNEEMLREADRMGLMVWEEVPVYWTIQWENPATLRNAENQLNEAITRDHNRASLIIYSVANETPITEERNRFLRALIQSVRTHDSTRLLSAALQNREEKSADRLVIHIEDPVGNDLDIIGDNEYLGWYSRTPDEIAATDWVSGFGKPLIMSEFGADALYGFHADADTRWSEEYQEKVYRNQLAMLKRIPFLRGMSPWILKDFRSPRRTLPGVQDYFNRKGLLTGNGEKKKAYFVLRDYYRELQSREQAVIRP